MITSRSKLREAIHKRAERRRQRTITIVVGSSVILFLLLAAVWFSSVAASQPVDHAVTYDPDQVTYAQPLTAVHEMTGPSLQSIPSLPKAGPQPKLAVSQPFFDFKRIGHTEVVQHQFIIANEGEAPLTISRAYTSCACTTADFTATVIPPGKIAIMTLTFDAGVHDVRGQTVRRGVIIESNDPASPQTEIWIQASVNATP